jgi:hypothetical protein
VDTVNSTRERPLRPGDLVEVKSPAEIFATLDGDAVDDMPFMAEMLQHAGNRYTVSRRVDKICDTVTSTGSRRLTSTVYLDDLRCDGSAHGGCQAGCRLYWKEDWLRRVDADTFHVAVPQEPCPELDAALEQGIHTERDGEELWRCQNTESVKATTPLKVFKNPDQYWREFTNGNYRRLHFMWLFLRSFVLEVAHRFRLTDQLPLRGPHERAPESEPLNLQPGEWVRVRTPEEIIPTLDKKGFNRGLSFDREMARLCGQTFRVKARVTKLIAESTGRMVTIKRDAIILEGGVCSGECSTGRWFCPREIYAYWREAWLERVEPPRPQAADETNGTAVLPIVTVNGSDRSSGAAVTEDAKA